MSKFHIVGNLMPGLKCVSITTYSAFFGIRWCVLQTMQYARCTMEDVIRVTQRSEVRIGLLDNIPDDCGKYMYCQFI